MKYFTIMTIFLRIGILKDVYKKGNKRLLRGLLNIIYCAMVILADIQINDVSVLLVDFLFQNLEQLILEIHWPFQLKMLTKVVFCKIKDEI